MYIHMQHMWQTCIWLWSRGEVMGKYLQHCQSCSCVAGREKASAQLQTEASASQIASASVSCPLYRPGQTRPLLDPTPHLNNPWCHPNITSFFFSFFFFHPYCWCHTHCLLNINRCWSGGGEVAIGLDSLSSCPICPSTPITTSASVLTSPGLFVHLYLCFSPPPPPPFPLSPFGGGRLRNDQSGFDAAGLCPGFPKHMSPGNYDSTPRRLLLLCNAPVWIRRKRARRWRRKRRRWRGFLGKVGKGLLLHVICTLTERGAVRGIEGEEGGNTNQRMQPQGVHIPHRHCQTELSTWDFDLDLSQTWVKKMRTWDMIWSKRVPKAVEFWSGKE